MSESLKERLKSTRVLIVTHVYATGPAQDLEAYLRDRVASLVFIGHPFPYAQDTRSFWRRFERGTLVGSGTFPALRGPAALSYVKDVLLTLFWARGRGPHYDLAVCADGLNAWCGLVLRFFGKVDRVVFYTIDWTSRRFPNRVLNMLYHALDRIGVVHADRTWNLSPRMAKARARQRGIPTGRQITVPVGVFLDDRALALASRPRTGHRVAFLGHLRMGQGLPLLFDSFTLVAAREPRASLVIVGTGPLESELQARALHAGISQRVEFRGFVASHGDVEEILRGCDIAVAPYERDTFTYYTDPGKPKAYLAAGLPVVITDVPAVAREIARAGAGVLVSPDVAELAEAMTSLLADPVRCEAMRRQAILLAESFRWDRIFPAALGETLSLNNNKKPRRDARLLVE